MAFVIRPDLYFISGQGAELTVRNNPMNFITALPGPAAFLAVATMAALAPASLAAQSYDPSQVRSNEEVMTTVYGSPPADLTGLAAGPEVEGFISARSDTRIRVSDASGASTLVLLSPATEIKASGGFLDLFKADRSADSLLNGLPVTVKTAQWGDGLIARRVTFKGDDLETAAMIRSGTSQKFAEQGAAISQNTAATEALRGRFGDIDQYNLKGTTNVYFDSGKYDLSAHAESELCYFAAQAETMDNALLLVVGYTDSTGSYEVNQALSEKRAGRVVNYLQQQCGWKPYRMLAPTGMAQADPVADNSTAAGKAQNRRVAVNILVSKSVDDF